MNYELRRNKLREKISREGLDALLVSYPSNRYYLSGFELHDTQLNESSGHILVTASGDDYLCTDSRFFDAARRIWPEDKIFIYRGNGAEALGDFLKAKGSKVGIEGDSLCWGFVRKLAEKINPIFSGGLVESLRLIKDAEELSALKKSFELNHAMLTWIRGELAEGMSEKDVAWMIERYFREHGASELAFPSIVAFGKNAALPHALPSDLRLAPETGVLLDVGCRVCDYCSDQTRSFWFGQKEEERFKTARELVAEAQSTAISVIKKGLPAKEASDAATAVFRKAGVESHFTHSLGHGVGLDTHEWPRLAAKAEDPLLPGMVVTVEPGLYYPEWGGIRLEFTVVVEENGARIL